MIGFSWMFSQGARTFGKSGAKYAVNEAGYAVKASPWYKNTGGLKTVAKTVPEWLKPIAMFAGAGALAGWAGSNVYQTEKISDDSEEMLDFQKEKWDWEKERYYEEQEARQEDFENSLFQTGLIEAFDVKDRQFQAQMQANQQSFETQMYNAKLMQLAEDRNTYLANQAFQMYTGGRQTSKDDQFTVAFILTELMSILQSELPEEIEQPDLDPYYEPSFDEL